ncbi:arylsulfatase [Aquisalinus flavus]|uniref:Arylsulfatase n=1 Tax=Aquisalinus flavus TaxID=1526572 RepID=A0A8J2Y816_9PROT|nr:arylsulfatase [Aquisalinus flavus]MBD0425993.1 arylsulfatase [Aquisalinus flavus]UNE48415.1 arylsulfatase [Aquisalinus flavus]GGD11569.1 arylsulfatase [Aquisalinus flavus]
MLKRAIPAITIIASCIFAYAAEPIDESELAGRADRPNIVIILVDDMGFSDFGSYGGEIPTPNIDALANDGVRFTQFYNTARCSSTRASLLTGLYPHQAGMGHLPSLRLPESRGTRGRLLERSVTIPELLREEGYFTAITGKWHLSLLEYSTPWERGFDRSMTSELGGIFFKGQPPRRQQENDSRRTLYVDGKVFPTTDEIFGEDEWYSTDLWTRWGIRYIDEARAAGKPFFLYLSHHAPHFPLMAPQEDISRFRGQYMTGWEPLREKRYRRQLEMGLFEEKTSALTPLLPDTFEWDELSDEQKDRFDHMMAIYAAMISRIDLSVGDLVRHLEETGDLDNTIILIMSDNGANAESGPAGRTDGELPLGGRKSNVFTGMNWAALQNTPYRYFKHFTAEGGIATPMILHWPDGIAEDMRGAFYKEPGHVIDVMATSLDAADAAYPAAFNGIERLPTEGVSLLPALVGDTLDRGQPLFWEHEGNRAVRDGRWKAVSRLTMGWELYDIENDRTEMNDLAGQYPDRLQTMVNQWEAWAERTYVDPWPQDVPHTDWGGLRVLHGN